MSNDTQAAPAPQQPGARAVTHAVPANLEQHLLEAHNLSVQIQGKEGPTGQGVWALIRENRGKVQTLAVHRGTRREAVSHFYSYIHPAKETVAPAPTRRSSYPPRQQSSRPGGPGSSGRGPRR